MPELMPIFTNLSALESTVEVVQWFEWNGTDLTQFGTVEEGSRVASSGWSVVSHAGKNWIRGTITAKNPAGNAPATSSVLPLSAASFANRPTGNSNMIVMVDFIAWAIGAALVGAQVFPLFTSVSDALVTGFGPNGGAAPHEIYKFTAGEGVSSLGLGQADPATLTAQENGIRMGLAVEGSLVITTLLGERQIIVDASGDVSETGLPALGMRTGNTAGATNTSYFRNFRCLSFDGNGVPFAA
jgi:hypothetical protein